MKSEPTIVTITLNPAIDQTVFVDRLTPGSVHRVRRSHRQAGGKGVNVATMLALAGREVTATGFLGAANDRIFVEHFQRLNIRDVFVRASGETRTGIKIVDTEANDTTDFNLPGLKPSEEAAQELLGVLAERARPGTWFVLAGSLPEAVGPEFLTQIVDTLRKGGAQIAIDSSGAALRAAVKAGVDLAKPNVHELSELVGRELEDFSEVVAAARDLQQSIPNLVVSLGHEGALFLTPEQEVMASAPPVKVVSTVGAGDSVLAGFLHARLRGDDLPGCARSATVFAWSRLESITPSLPQAAVLSERLARITVQPLTSLPLTSRRKPSHS